MTIRVVSLSLFTARPPLNVVFGSNDWSARGGSLPFALPGPDTAHEARCIGLDNLMDAM
jgi:hypothetical protein